MSEIMSIEGLVGEQDLEHYGIPRKSGRYPWGSGDNPYHHGSSSPSGRKKARQETRAIRKDRRSASKNRRKLSDEEIARRIARLEKEKRLKELTTDDLYPGKREVDDAMKSVGKKLLIVGGTAAGLVAFNAVANKIGGNDTSVSETVKLVKDVIKGAAGKKK